MLHYVVRNAQGHFYNPDNNFFWTHMGDARLFMQESTAIYWAQVARSSYPEAGVKVSAFPVEFSDV